MRPCGERSPSTGSDQRRGVRPVSDDQQLAAPTPCPEYTVGDLLDHVAGLGRRQEPIALSGRDPNWTPTDSNSAEPR
ncbi:MAG: maleylpyruvate isomerase N-terminal domain-containing protein [Actinomycetota bacterium]|nr:maleylpyruvate isomerase N-terminal domain-containing protein [Actinomycetota bacterium]MDQ3350914.1 maleylpyruvate isomerase N-terminal domain-containing protein [Actinomycetota bacterium]